MEAARAFANAPTPGLSDAQRAGLDRARAEYVAAEQFNADRPESHLNLALFSTWGASACPPRRRRRFARRSRWTRASPPAAVNLADLYRATGRDAEGERVLRRALER